MRYFFLVLLSWTYLSAAGQSGGDDWADMAKYEHQNAALPPPVPGKPRVVFMGSSVIEFWRSLDAAYFEKRNFIDRGISGQISPQMLVRFRADVIDLQPKAVVILAGSNDIAKDTSQAVYGRIMNNIQSMVDLAKQHQIKVFLCTYVPISDYPWRRGLHPAGKIMTLNKMIRAYAGKENISILDFFTPLANKENGQRAELTRDGVHPNLKGYQLLEAVTDTAINRWKPS